MANRKRETDEERARRDREERIALLKMKQGIIEESELIPENEHAEARKLTGREKVSNFIYRNKAYILLGAFFTFVVTLLTVQLLTREKEDLYVLAIAFDSKSEMGWRYGDLTTALEKYCPDFDENGKANVVINYIDRTSGEIYSDYDRMNAQKLTMEFMAATSQFIIADEEILEWLSGDEGPDTSKLRKYFVDLTDLCSEDMLYEGVGVRVNQTALAKQARWENCPDNVVIFVRAELDNGSSSVKKNARNRERAMTVLKNIIDGNIVNTD